MAPAQPTQIIYSFVARGAVVLAEYTSFSGNFSTIAQQCLDNLPPSNNKFTFPHGGHTLNYLIQDGFAYMVLCDESMPRQIAFAFLERVKNDFSQKYAKKAADVQRLGLNKEYGPKLKEHMKFVHENPEEMNKMAKIQAQVQEVKGVMKDNIDKVLQRGEKMESLMEKTDVLREQANNFQKRSTEIRKKMWYDNMKTKMVIIVLIVIVILVIWLSVCGGFTCT